MPFLDTLPPLLRGMWLLSAFVALATLSLAAVQALTGRDLLSLWPVGVPLCLFKHLLHVPCPTCGLTRAFVLLAQGHLSEASRFHALSLPLALMMLIFLVLAPRYPTQAQHALRRLASPVALGALILIGLLAWGLKLQGDSARW